MNKLRLGRAVYACVIAFTVISTAEAYVGNAGKYAAQDTFIHGMSSGAGQVRRGVNDSHVSGLKGAVFGVGCGLIGVFLLHMANKR